MAADADDVAPAAPFPATAKTSACRYCLAPITPERFQAEDGLCEWCSLPEQIFVAWECGCASTFQTRDFPVACPIHRKLYTRVALVRAL